MDLDEIVPLRSGQIREWGSGQPARERRALAQFQWLARVWIFEFSRARTDRQPEMALDSS